MSKSLATLIDIATDEKQTEDDWSKILDVCESGTTNPKDCLKLILKRMSNRNPHIILRCIILLDACMQNVGETFAKEISSRYFVTDIKSRTKNMHHKTLERLCFMTKKWSRELQGPEYDCIRELNKWLQDTHPSIYAAGDDELNSRHTHRTNRKQIVAQEEEDLAKAIALSLKEGGSGSSVPQQQQQQIKSSNLYPVASNVSAINSTVKLNDLVAVPPAPKIGKVRALYDFEAAEDNELSFKAGEIIVDVDVSDEHWWYGRNHRGEGMFPAQFVTSEVDNSTAKIGLDKLGSAVVENKVTTRAPTPVIDESKIDSCLKLLDETDPTGELRPDPLELNDLEGQCRQMGPLIDQELEKVDRHYNTLVDFNRKVMMAFQTYNELMTQSGVHRPGPTSFQWQPNPQQYMSPHQHQHQQANMMPPSSVGYDVGAAPMNHYHQNPQQQHQQQQQQQQPQYPQSFPYYTHQSMPPVGQINQDPNQFPVPSNMNQDPTANNVGPVQSSTYSGLPINNQQEKPMEYNNSALLESAPFAVHDYAAINRNTGAYDLGNGFPQGMTQMYSTAVGHVSLPRASQAGQMPYVSSQPFVPYTNG